MRVYPLIALAALSCSPAAKSDGPDAAANTVAASSPLPVASPTASPGIVPVTDTAVARHLGELTTFGDWTIGCDNARACQANALVPETDDRDGYLLLLIERGGAPDAPARLIVPIGKTPPTHAMLTVDGKPFAPLSGTGDTATLTLDRARAAALANGKTVALTTPTGTPIATVSLAGLAASLLYMDAQQQRVGTTSALRKPGAGTAPAELALPVISMPPPSTAKPATLSVAAATKLIGPDNAFCDYAIGPIEPEAHRIDATHSLVLVAHPCGNGAYNLFSSAFVVEDSGNATPARFDAPPGIAEEDKGDIINADWDAKAHRLTTYGKGRGIGDCGTIQAFAWDGTRFRLVEQSAMGECRGSIDYIPVWRARTATR
ncbi:DUF1176 domain-containing protein [Sphingomonas oligophenolica]|nr:DUF1176 domain-containing protein [Sphingomonas oligophenolica]